MFFKLSNRNPYRDLLKHLQRIHSAKISEEQRVIEYRTLYKVISPRLKESKQFLHSSPAFSERCEHWNQRDIAEISPMTNLRNPWLSLKRAFEEAVNGNDDLVGNRVSIELGWFMSNPYLEDWIAKT